MRDTLRRLFVPLILVLASVASAGASAGLDGLGGGGGQEDVVPAEEAFAFEVERVAPRELIARWDIKDGYYLYRDKIDIRIEGADGLMGSVDLPSGQTHSDEYFGEQQIYRQPVAVSVPLTRAVDEPFTVVVDYQGCADAGLCYQPQTTRVTVTANGATAGGDGGADTGGGKSAAAGGTGWFALSKAALGDTLAGGQPLVIIGVFALAGLALAFTACLYPMIPILSGLIAGDRHRGSGWRALGLSLVYVEAMAVTYAVAGVLAGWTGAALQASLQSPWVLGAFAGLFVLLALSMFGLFEFQLPASWQTRINNLSARQRGGTVLGVAIMGVLSTLIVGACSGPALAAGFAFVARTGDWALGGMALFAMANGMGLPLLLVGVGAGKWLPTAGGWMEVIRRGFGVVFLGVALVLLDRFLPGALMLGLWGGLFVAVGVFVGAFDRLKPDAGAWYRLRRAAGLVLLIWGTVALIGAAAGGDQLSRPLAALGVSPGGDSRAPASDSAVPGADFQLVRSVDELDRALADARDAGRPVLIDVYADWCVACVELDEHTFSDSRVQEMLSDAVLLRVDVTEQNASDKALQRRLDVRLPPAVIFYRRDGGQARDLRVAQFLGPDAFMQRARGVMEPGS